MYLWNIKSLNKDLKNWLSPKEDIKYLIIYNIIWLSVLFFPTQLDLYWYINSSIFIVFAIIMVYILYKANGWENWKYFLSRYFAIGFVSLIRSIIFLAIPLIIIFSILWIIINWTSAEYNTESTTIYDIAFTVFYNTWYIYLSKKYFLQLKEVE